MEDIGYDCDSDAKDFLMIETKRIAGGTLAENA
jgi:hypothetical protein